MGAGANGNGQHQCGDGSQHRHDVLLAMRFGPRLQFLPQGFYAAWHKMGET